MAIPDPDPDPGRDLGQDPAVGMAILGRDPGRDPAADMGRRQNPKVTIGWPIEPPALLLQATAKKIIMAKKWIRIEKASVPLRASKSPFNDFSLRFFYFLNLFLYRPIGPDAAFILNSSST